MRINPKILHPSKSESIRTQIDLNRIFKRFSTNEIEHFFPIDAHWLGHRFRNDSEQFGWVRNESETFAIGLFKFICKRQTFF